MKRAKRNYIIYTVMLIVFALAMVWVAQVGKNYDGMAPQPGAGVTQSMGEMIYGTLTGNLNHPLSPVAVADYRDHDRRPDLLLFVQIPRATGCDRRDRCRHCSGPLGAGALLPGDLLFPVRSRIVGSAQRDQPDRTRALHVRHRNGTRSGCRPAQSKRNPRHQSCQVSSSPFSWGMIWPMSSIPSSGPDTPHLCRSRCLSPFRSVLPPSLFWPVSCRNGIWERRRWVCWPSPVRPTNDVTAWCLLAAVIAVARAGNVASAFGYHSVDGLLYPLHVLRGKALHA